MAKNETYEPYTRKLKTQICMERKTRQVAMHQNYQLKQNDQVLVFGHGIESGVYINSIQGEFFELLQGDFSETVKDFFLEICVKQ